MNFDEHDVDDDCTDDKMLEHQAEWSEKLQKVSSPATADDEMVTDSST